MSGLVKNLPVWNHLGKISGKVEKSITPQHKQDCKRNANYIDEENQLELSQLAIVDCHQ